MPQRVEEQDVQATELAPLIRPESRCDRSGYAARAETESETGGFARARRRMGVIRASNKWNGSPCEEVEIQYGHRGFGGLVLERVRKTRG